MHTEIRTSIPVLAGFAGTAALLALAACGGGGGSATTSGNGTGQGPVTTIAELTRPADAGLTPAIQVGGELRIGAMPAPARTALAPVAVHGPATVNHGRVPDGLGANALAAYLRHDATEAEGAHGRVARFAAAPTVRYAAGTTPGQIAEIVHAVQLYNANLPRAFQLSVDPVPVSTADSRAGVDATTLPPGQILIQYAARADWHGTTASTPNAGGVTQTFTYSTGEIATGRVWIDHIRLPGIYIKPALVHELGHVLGRKHPDRARFPDTIMTTGTPNWIAGYLLHPLDREALLAVYGTLEPGTLPGAIAADLGPWEDESLHIRGGLGSLAFGAALRNGLVRPWALGPAPGSALEHNPQLTGSASWSGRLLGLTPGGDTVAGAAGLAVDLGTLSGTLGFTGMESWAAAPGAPGTGATWGAGDLNYTVAVDGNAFRRTGGDAGSITGVFFGAAHQGMGGTLVRDDLGAGFAGTR